LFETKRTNKQTIDRSIDITKQPQGRAVLGGQQKKKMPQGFTRRAIGVLLSATVLLLIWRVSNYHVPVLGPGTLSANTPKPSGGNHGRRVAKVSMLYGHPNPLYDRALQSHDRHAQRWGYPMHVLQQDISAGFWNKPSYVLSLVIQELAKPASKRMEWLMCVNCSFYFVLPRLLI
jgi:hypothetical protein